MDDGKLSAPQIAGLATLALASLGSAVTLIAVNGQSITPGRLLSAVMAFVVLVGIIRSRGGGSATRWVLGLMSFVGLTIVFSLLNAPDQSRGLTWAVLALFGLVAFVIQFWYSSQSSRYATAALDILLVLWFALIALTVAEYATQIHFANSHVFIDQRLSGRIATLTWVNPNNTPFILTVLMAPALYAAARRPPWVRTAVWAGIGWLIYLSVFVNDARLGTVVLLMVIILWAILQKSDWRIALVTAVIAIVAVFPATAISQGTTISDLAPYSPVSQWAALFSATRDITDAPEGPSSIPADTSTGNRFRLWAKAVDVTITHPIVGLGAAGYQYLLATGDQFLGIEDPHSLFLDAGANLGLLGAVALTAALGLMPILVLVRDRRSMLGRAVIVATFAFAAGSFGPSTTWSLTLAWAAVGLIQGAWISTISPHVQAGGESPDASGDDSGGYDRQQIRTEVAGTGEHDRHGDEE